MTTENTVDAILINGTADNDSIINFGDDVTIDSGSGNDTIYSGLDDRKADRVSINAGAGDNVISIQGGSDSVTIRTGDGNNLIGSTSPNNAVFSGAGNDSVVFYTGSDNNTVETGDGDDVIQAVGHNVIIDAGGGNDGIRTFRNAYDITTKGGTGDDDITLGGPVDTDHTNVVQYAEGDGNDSITDFSATDTLQITSGSISGASLVGNNVEISVGSGKITLIEANEMNINIVDADGILHQTIFSGGDTISTVVNDTLIAGTDGEDYLINDKGKNVTINAFAGNDTIDNTGDNSIIDAGAGDDIVSVAGASNVTIRTGEGDNRVYTDNNGASELVYFGNGNNTIVTSNRNSTILGGNGNDLITFHNGSFGSSVEAGSGDDTIQVGHYDITVDAGAGNDLINLYRDAENALIIPGDGNDTITVYNNTHAQTFQYSGGNDLINGFKSIDTLKIVGPTSANTIVSDGNLIFDFGDGSLTLAGVSSVESLNVEYLNKWATIDGGKFQYSGIALNNPAKVSSFTVSGESLTGTDNLSVKRIVYMPEQDAFRFELNGINGNATIDDVDLEISGDSNYSTHFTKINDQLQQNNIVLMDVSDGATVDSNYTAGVDNDGLIKFSDGEHSVLTSDNPQGKVTSIEASNGGDGFELNVSDGIFGTIGGLNDGYAVTINAGDNIGDEVTFQTDGGNGTITIADETLSAGGENDFTVEFDDEGKIITSKWSTIDGGFVYSGHTSNNYAKTADVSLIGSELKDTNGDGAPDNITVNAFNYSSVTGVMAFMSGFGGEVTLNNKDVGVIGDDDYEIHFTAKVIDNAPANVIAYTNTKEVRGISTGATVNPNESDMVGFDSNAKAHVGDVTKFLLYNKNHKGGGSPHATIGIDNNGAGADLTFKDDILTEIDGLNDGYSFSIISSDNISDELKFNDVGSGSLEFTSNIDDTVKVNFSGTSSAQSITGSGNSIELIGSSDDDLLIAGATNTTLTGGAGNDTFRGSAGLSSCVITDYTEGEDVIYHGKSFSDFSINGSISGNDYIFDVAQAGRTITVKNGANKIIKGVDVNGDERLFGKYLTLDDNDAATVTAQDGVATIDAVLRTEDIVINGNSGDNTIISSSGNCTLYGGAGSDLFVSGAGNDVITDYTEDDKISLGAAVSSSYISGAAAVLTTDAGTLTIQNANDKTLSLIDSAGKEFSINASNTTEIINDVTAQASNVESVAADATGNQNITLNSGEAAIIAGTSAKVNITTSKGNDTIVSTGKHVDIDLKAGGATKIYAAEGRATVENYNAKTGAAFLTENENIADAIDEKSIAYDDGKLTVNSAQVTFADDVDSRFINFVETDDDTQKVGFVSDDSKLDASSESGNLILVGASNSTLTGGKGKNQIYLDDNSESTILLNGRNTINNFNASFADGDKVSVDATNHDFNFDGVNLKITSGTARATLQNISSDADSTKILTVTNGKEIKTAIAQAGAVITTGNELADVYYGKKSGVDFSAYDESLTIDLNKNFYGINQITVGGGLNTLFSSSANETLTGNSNGTTEFIFDAGAGHDVISNFNFAEDKISVGAAVSNVVLRNSGDVIVQLGEEWITLEDAQGKTFRINDFAAQVDANISYNANTNYFLATAKNASVTVGEEAEIWLDGSHGKNFVGNIKTLDASNSDGRNTLAGNDADNIICAGAGDASLWGGNGGDDLLTGGDSRNTFFYCNGNGRDTISGINDGDAVILSDISLDQIISTNISTDAVAINFIDGGSLQINGSADVTYQLADGSKFSANHQNSEWLKSN